MISVGRDPPGAPTSPSPAEGFSAFNIQNPPFKIPSLPSTRKTLENKIQSAFENKAEPEFIEKTVKSLVQTGILEFTETDKVNDKAA